MIDKLYETIGGNRTIWAATEAFYRRVLADPELQPFFQSVDMKHLVARRTRRLHRQRHRHRSRRRPSAGFDRRPLQRFP